MNYNEIKKLLMASALNQPTNTFSAEDVHEAARNALIDYFGVDGVSSLAYMNPSDFRIIDEVIAEVMPKKLENILGPWAEIKTYDYNDSVVFRVERGATTRRFKEVVVPGQSAGIYRARRMDSDVLEVKTEVLTAAYNITLEEILTGTVNVAQLVQLIAEGFSEQIYLQMIHAFRSLKALSKFTGAVVGGTPDGVALDEIIAKASAFGPVTIFGFRSALAELSNSANITDANWEPNRSADDLKDIRQHGRVLIYKGTPVIQLENYLLSDNSWAFNEDDIYIIPGGNKPIKVALHGPAHTEEVKIPSGGFEWHTSRRVGVAISSAGGIGVYTLEDTYEGKY